MKLIQINRDPSDRQLRQFGLIALVALPAVTWFWIGGNVPLIAGMGAAGALLAGVGWFRPQALRPIFVGLCYLFLPIGLVVGELALLTIYLTVFAPMGLLFRLFGRDRLHRSFEPSASTYWQEKRQPGGAASYLRQW